MLRVLRLALIAAVVVAVVLAALRIADVLTPADVRWYAERSLALIVLGAIAGVIVGVVSRGRPAGDSTDRPVP